MRNLRPNIAQLVRDRVRMRIWETWVQTLLKIHPADLRRTWKGWRGGAERAEFGVRGSRVRKI